MFSDMGRYEKPTIEFHEVTIELLSWSEIEPSAGDVEGPGFREEGYSTWDEEQARVV